MHELSIMRTMIAEVERIVKRAGDGLVAEIHLGCGSLSGFEPACLRSAFEQLCEGGTFETTQLVIHPIALAAACDQCSVEFAPVGFAFCCPECGSHDTRIFRGEGLILESVVLADAVEVRSP